MFDICLFSGTTEGRRLAELLSGTQLQTLVCVATEYGGTLTPRADNLQVSTGRMDQNEMAALFLRHRFGLVVDATHPHAVRVTDNILAAARQTGTPHLRLLREAAQVHEGITYVDSIAEAAEHLKNSTGNVLVTTGSKELAPYTAIPDYQKRLVVRLLPTPEALAACAACGIPPQNIVAMQGPFSEAMNRAMLRDREARYLVTKESGHAGGLEEKLAAARAEGAQVILIGRPPQVDGVDMAGVVRHIRQRFQVSIPRKIHLVSMGLGTPDTWTAQARAALEQADCLIGARRLLDAQPDGKPRHAAILPDAIVRILGEHPEYIRPAVLFSGDAGFYSGARKLLPRLAGDEVVIVPGISSLQALCARAQTAWEDAHVLSLHGREGSIAQAASLYPKVFALVGGEDGARRLVDALCLAGLSDVRVCVGERMGYADERLTEGPAQALRGRAFDPLSAVLVLNEGAAPPGSPHLPDDAFLRQTGDTLVPMTKAEVRAVSVAKLQLPMDAVVYDIGAGTGSVSVEIAKSCPMGSVYAIERSGEACLLIEANARRHRCHQLTVVHGDAPEACLPLPPPTHAFIGGSGGNLDAMLRMLLGKNPDVRIVINLIALESIAQALASLNAMAFEEVDIAQVQVSKARAAGPYRLMTAQNPVWVITCRHAGRGKEAADDKPQG